MKKFLRIGLAAVLFLLTQGCYVGFEQPPTDYYGEPSSYEPPPIALSAPPDVIVMPYTNDIYAVPDIDVDLFFWNGWWWRPWNGRWYRSENYKQGWRPYNSVPGFYSGVDPGWRKNYRDRNWQGYRWNCERIPSARLQHNWRTWQGNKYWEKEKSWGLERHHPQTKEQRGQQSVPWQPRDPGKLPDVEKRKPEKAERFIPPAVQRTEPPPRDKVQKPASHKGFQQQGAEQPGKHLQGIVKNPKRYEPAGQKNTQPPRQQVQKQAQKKVKGPSLRQGEDARPSGQPSPGASSWRAASTPGEAPQRSEGGPDRRPANAGR